MTATSIDTNAVLITGASGFVGSQLVERLDDSIAISRNQARTADSLGIENSRVIPWDGQSEFPILQSPASIRGFVNLMGESIAHGRWTDAKKKRIRDSRVLGTRHIVDSMIKHRRFPEVFVSASAIGFYGDSGESPIDESHDAGSGFLTDVCVEWENEAKRLEEHNVRVVLLRIGIVIGKDGGAFKEMAPMFRWGLGGRLGSGKQWVSWIHVKDLVAMIDFCLSNPIAGAVNATSPNPVTNSQFTTAMANELRRYAIFPAPQFLLRMVLGEFADSLFFSQRILPNNALSHGFKFEFETIQSAIADANRQD